MPVLEENILSKQVDSAWDTWLKSFKTIQSYQDEAQQKLIESFTYQKEILDYSIKSFTEFEEKSQEISKELTEKLEATITESKIVPEDQFSKWLRSFTDVSSTVQAISWKPSHVFFEVFTKAQGQIEENVKKALELQKTESEKNLLKIEELVEQVKVSQKEILSYYKL